jgi:Leucine-rich repeat (LRR) protein
VSDEGLAHFKDCKNLTHLALLRTQASKKGLAHFKDCKNLTILDLCYTPVSNLSILNGMTSLRKLLLNGVPLSDLTPLQSLKLTQLLLSDTKGTDLSPLKEMPLKDLWIYDTRVTDLTPLQALSLEEIRLTPKNITKGQYILRDMKSLERIGVDYISQPWPAVEFWARHDKGEFK